MWRNGPKAEPRIKAGGTGVRRADVQAHLGGGVRRAPGQRLGHQDLPNTLTAVVVPDVKRFDLPRTEPRVHERNANKSHQLLAGVADKDHLASGVHANRLVALGPANSEYRAGGWPSAAASAAPGHDGSAARHPTSARRLPGPPPRRGGPCPGRAAVPAPAPRRPRRPVGSRRSTPD